MSQLPKKPENRHSNQGKERRLKVVLEKNRKTILMQALVVKKVLKMLVKLVVRLNFIEQREASKLASKVLAP